MSDNEIKTAIKCAILNAKSVDCKVGYIEVYKLEQAVNLIKRLQAEIERLKTVHYCIDKVILGQQEFAIADEYLIAYQNALERLYNNINLKSAARKEFAEKLEERISVYTFSNKSDEYVEGFADALDSVNGCLDNLLEEMENEV